MKKYNISILTLFVSMLLVSCELTDVVDQDPPNNLVPENVVTNSKDAEALLNGVYSTIISFSSSHYYMYTELIPGALSGSMSDIGWGSTNGEFEQNNVRPDNSHLNSFWKIFYEVINGANNSIELIRPLPETEFSGSRKSEILGEAHFLRAMATFDALRYFGQFYDLNSDLGIIVRTEPVNFVSRNKERSTVQSTYDQILKDLDYAIANAPDFSMTYKASKVAAMALKARVLLFMGEYAEAANMADLVIQSGVRGLATDFPSVFSKGLNSEEIIFMTYRDENSYSEDNNRKRYYGGEPGTTWLPLIMSADPRQPFTYEGSNVLKTNQEDTYRPTYFIRLAEMYLIKAEGLLRSGATLAAVQQPLNMVRNRAGIGNSPAVTLAEVREEIFAEWVRELVFENGSEWFAAIRFGKAMELKPEINSTDQFILPIPEDELFGNAELTLSDQNPGYL